jgi:hypothetical protein
MAYGVILVEKPNDVYCYPIKYPGLLTAALLTAAADTGCTWSSSEILNMLDVDLV